jgi:hypothetical protein
VSCGIALEHRGHHEAAHSIGGVGDDAPGAQRRRVDERHDVVGERLEEVAATSSTRLSPQGSGAATVETSCAVAFTSSNPVSWPTGRAPDRQSLTPLYCAGLCDAVNTAPGASSVPAA